MNEVIKGLRPAAARAGISVRSLRELLGSGAIAACKQDGVWTFDVGALDALRAARGQVALLGASPVSVPVNTVIAMPSASAPVPMGSLPDWMVAAADMRDEVLQRGAPSDGEGDEDDAEARQPYMGIPLGSRAATLNSGWPYSAVGGTTSADSLRTAELEQQLADVMAQRDGWYRAARIKSIADTIANEAMAASGDIQVAQAAAHAAAHALSTLTSDQLALDSIAIPHAQHFGHQVGTSWAQAAWNANDIERARARRRRRSPRW